MTSIDGQVSLRPPSERGRKKRTERDFELWRELDRLSDFHYAAGGRVVQEALEVQDEHWRERLDEHLLACFARAGGADLHGLWLRDVCERILDGVYRIALYNGRLMVNKCVAQRGKKADLDIELERPPVFDDYRIALVWRAQRRAELATEYACNGRLDRLDLFVAPCTRQHTKAQWWERKGNDWRTVRVSTTLLRLPTSVHPWPDWDSSSRSSTLDAEEAGWGGLIEASRASNSSSSVSR
jgi:hypothetical protein